MSGQSPQRIRKPQALPTTQGPMQNIAVVPREASPSPSFRERQRNIKAHSMPIVPSVSQVLANSGQQTMHQQPSPTTSNSSHQSRRSPPPVSRISPVTAKIPVGSLSNPNARDRSPERLTSPPPLIHAHSQPVVSQLVSSTQPQQPRPLRGGPPQFLTQYQTTDEQWQMTPELMADIERADQALQQGQLQGTAGVAYAGGAASSGILHLQHIIAVTARDPAVERVRASDRASPKEQDNPAKRVIREKEREPQGTRESPKTRERSQTTSSVPPNLEPQVRTQDRTPEYRGSPQYQTPLASPGERTAAYTQYIPDSYQPTQGPTASVPRKAAVPNPTDPNSSRATPPATSKLVNQTSPVASVNVRASDRSLPVQEEPEEDIGHELPGNETDYHERHHSSPTPSSDLYPEGHQPRYETIRPLGNGEHHSGGDEDDDETLNEEADDHVHQSKGGDEDDDSGFTPRSPSTTLPEHPHERQFAQYNGQYTSTTTQYSQNAAENQKTIRAKHRSGSTDQLGMRNFDAVLFENTVNNLRNGPQGNGHRQQPQPPRPPPQPIPQTEPQMQQSHPGYQTAAGQYTSSRVDQDMAYTSKSLPVQMPQYLEDIQNFFDDPTSSYIQAYLNSAGARPNAPVPPTPQSHTAAPSPSPAISAMPSDIEARQIGSPYPYPFTHIRRTALSAAQNAPSSSFDPNNPAFVREQLARQMQIYAINNGLALPSDSTFSPSSTPFPGPSYNPWAFIQQAPREGDSNMSLRSSPSHEPVAMPMPPTRGRGLRRKETVTLHSQGNVGRRRVKPPPRVESTQPRETSPEPSSGEETAGEERYVDQYVSANGAEERWENGVEHAVISEDDGEWVDENDEGEDDLLQLEYHPSFVSRPEKRRRRWETRWDALTQAFQALDRETDTTLVLLAAPSHSTKRHALISRSIRRDPTLFGSEEFASIRSSFSRLAVQRRATRTHRISLAEQLSRSGSSAGSQGSGETREEDLRQALEAALGSLGALGTIYEQREARWREEMRRVSEDREHVELLLRQALGPALANGHDVGRLT